MLCIIFMVGYIYTSSDYGVTWTEQTAAGSRGWSGVTSSSDGARLAAGVNQGITRDRL